MMRSKMTHIEVNEIANRPIFNWATPLPSSETLMRPDPSRPYSKELESLKMTSLVSFVFVAYTDRSPPASGTSFFTGVRQPVRHMDSATTQNSSIIRFIELIYCV